MDWERQHRLLTEEIQALVSSLPTCGDLSALIREPLTKTKRGLAQESDCASPWPLLPLMVCEVISGTFEQALPAAASLQFLMAAGDVFDDIEDADSSDALAAKYGASLATSAATTLLILAEKAIVRLKLRGVDDAVTVRVMNAVNSAYLTACAGQHLDLTHGAKLKIAEEEYVNIAGMKSAVQIECACRVGALLSATDENVVEAFARFGYNLGMAAQIANDIDGVVKGADILKHNITLPVIFALANTSSDDYTRLSSAFGNESGPTVNAAQIRDLLFRCGAVHYATVKMEIYRQTAADILSRMEIDGVNVKPLKVFLQ